MTVFESETSMHISPLSTSKELKYSVSRSYRCTFCPSMWVTSENCQKSAGVCVISKVMNPTPQPNKVLKNVFRRKKKNPDKHSLNLILIECVYHSSWLACCVTELCVVRRLMSTLCPPLWFNQHPHQPGKPRQDAGGNTGIFYCQWCQRSEEVTMLLWSDEVWSQIGRIYVTMYAACPFRAFFYCKACHDDITDPKRIKKCGCKRRE